jgi:hypothetical protein
LKVPVLFIHGKLDVKVPFKMSQQLYDAAPEPKKRFLIEGGDHANCGAIGWVEYDAAVTTFVQTQFNRSEVISNSSDRSVLDPSRTRPNRRQTMSPQ